MNEGHAILTRAGVIAALLAAVAGGITTAGHADDRRAEQAPVAVPNLSWSSCQAVFQCAAAKVPLDYAEPHRADTGLGLIKRPADDPRHRIGTLFVHPGGPGNAITDPVFFAPLVNALGPRVRARFDIVGVDPRGTGKSTPASCTEPPGVPPVAKPADSYPSDGQYDRRFAYDDYQADSCRQTGNPIVAHMSTADDARDLDLIRRSVGDRKLNFYGLSYGSLLGQTYAAMFPDRMRAIAADAVLDPVDWTTGRNGDSRPPFARTGSGAGTAEAWNAALARCDRATVVQCPLTGNARARWKRDRASLTRRPLQLAGAKLNGKSLSDLTESAVQLDHISGLPVPAIPLWTGAVKLIDTIRFPATSPKSHRAKIRIPGRAAIDPAAPRDHLRGELGRAIKRLKRLRATTPDTAPAGAQTDDSAAAVGRPSMLGAWCADTRNPVGHGAWINAGKAAEARGPGFGAAHSWATSPCARWPATGADSYRGPFDGRTSVPLLMIGNTHDSTTPIAGVRSAAGHFPGSKVIEVRTWGHTALGKSNRCLRPAIESYLIDGKPPARNLTCKPDEGLYGLAP